MNRKICYNRPMNQKQWQFEELSQLLFFGMLFLLGLLAMINPAFVYSIFGVVIGMIGVVLLSYFAYKIYRHFQLNRQLKTYFLPSFIGLFFLSLLFIFIPASSLSSMVAWSTFFGLVGYGFFRLYFKAKLMAIRLTLVDWSLGLAAWGLAILVLFNLNKTPDIIMFFIGGVLVYVSGFSLFKILIRHHERD